MLRNFASLPLNDECGDDGDEADGGATEGMADAESVMDDLDPAAAGSFFTTGCVTTRCNGGVPDMGFDAPKRSPAFFFLLLPKTFFFFFGKRQRCALTPH